MKQLLITIAAVVLVGCGESQQLAPTPEAKPVDPAAETIRKNLNNSQKPQINNELLSAVNKLNIEDLPTFGIPTRPHLNPISFRPLIK